MNVPEARTRHTGTQTVSNSYLRPETGDGKDVAEKTHKPSACAGRLSSR
jgi:hypothetical protein